MAVDNLETKTISDFGEQWSIYSDNNGWYGSFELFKDITNPLLDPYSLRGKTVADIGSGTGRIVNMLIEAGANHVYAIEPSNSAFEILKYNVKKMRRPNDVTCINQRGDCWNLNQQVDYIISVGVIHHISDPVPVIRNAFRHIKPGGHIFIWLYGYEGNELYIWFIEFLRKITTRLPHILLRGIVELLYCSIFIYKTILKKYPMPFRFYIEKVLWKMSPEKRRLVIYDQLNPAYAKYYKKNEAIQLLENSGFKSVKVNHRHGYSWSVIGQKP